MRCRPHSAHGAIVRGGAGHGGVRGNRGHVVRVLGRAGSDLLGGALSSYVSSVLRRAQHEAHLEISKSLVRSRVDGKDHAARTVTSLTAEKPERRRRVVDLEG